MGKHLHEYTKKCSKKVILRNIFATGRTYKICVFKRLIVCYSKTWFINWNAASQQGSQPASQLFQRKVSAEKNAAYKGKWKALGNKESEATTILKTGCLFLSSFLSRNASSIPALLYHMDYGLKESFKTNYSCCVLEPELFSVSIKKRGWSCLITSSARLCVRSVPILNLVKFNYPVIKVTLLSQKRIRYHNTQKTGWQTDRQTDRQGLEWQLVQCPRRIGNKLIWLFIGEGGIKPSMSRKGERERELQHVIILWLSP